MEIAILEDNGKIPELFEREVLLLKEKGVFDAVNGVLVQMQYPYCSLT